MSRSYKKYNLYVMFQIIYTNRILVFRTGISGRHLFIVTMRTHTIKAQAYHKRNKTVHIHVSQKNKFFLVCSFFLLLKKIPFQLVHTLGHTWKSTSKKISSHSNYNVHLSRASATVERIQIHLPPLLDFMTFADYRPFYLLSLRVKISIFLSSRIS